jgi:ammonia channel protein AmtB
MKLSLVVKTSFIAGFLLVFAGAYLKIIHSAYADNVLLPAVIVWIIFIVSAIYEVRSSEKIDNTAKTLWTLGFIFFAGFAGLLYMLGMRRRIAMDV